jgi:hypothetical protein
VIIDLCTALGQLFEPEADVTVVALDIEPLTWNVEHLYVYPVRVEENVFETGPTRKQDFVVNAVYVTESSDEARQDRDPALAALLDTKRGNYLRAVRENYHNDVWEHLAGVADDTRPRGLDKRSAAVRVSGWRLVI